MTTSPRLFHLQRDHDISGVSGTGRVADGVQWPDGTVTLRWIGDRPSTVHWDRLDDAVAIHGHSGATRIVWADEQPPADRAALRDRITNAIGRIPFVLPIEHRRKAADEVLAVLPEPADQAALVRACASFVRDTYSGEWADDAASTLETDADQIEQGEQCSLLRLADAMRPAVEAPQDGARP
ncbi:hypothetical protein ACFWOL_15440 [Streptomyces sp. NPDC058442]|uniref:hypothetical protein n=1 Tax=Streptomyces sp. NPDC058442 TaxID=3346503 RepID=UPI003647EA0F